MSSIKTDTQAFLSSLKKDYSNLTYNERVLANFYYNLVVLGVTNNTILIIRYSGAVEAILTNEGYLDPFKEFDYLITDHKILWFRYTKKEKYIDFLLRIGTKFLEDKEIL